MCQEKCASRKKIYFCFLSFVTRFVMVSKVVKFKRLFIIKSAMDLEGSLNIRIFQIVKVQWNGEKKIIQTSFFKKKYFNLFDISVFFKNKNILNKIVVDPAAKNILREILHLNDCQSGGLPRNIITISQFFIVIGSIVLYFTQFSCTLLFFSWIFIFLRRTVNFSV